MTSSVRSKDRAGAVEPVPAAATRAADLPAAQGPAARRSFLEFSERFGLAVLLILVIVVFSLWKPDTFFTTSNLKSIVTTQAVGIVAALALMPPLIAGRFDVSVGAIIGLSSVASAAAMSSYSLPLGVSVVVALLAGAIIGAFNGVIVSYFGVNSIIGTLGTSTIVMGVVQAYTNGTPISNGLSAHLTNLGITRIAGVPAIFVLAVVVAVLAWYVLTQTPSGKRLTAVGSNLRAAELTGIPTRRVVAFSFIGAGVLAGAAGVLQIGAQGAADPQAGGINFILPAIAAVFLGATTWRPGRFNVPGTVLALLFVGTTVSGLALVGARPWVTDVFNGGAIVVAIALSAQFRRRRTGTIEIGT